MVVVILRQKCRLRQNLAYFCIVLLPLSSRNGSKTRGGTTKPYITKKDFIRSPFSYARIGQLYYMLPVNGFVITYTIYHTTPDVNHFFQQIH